MTDVAGDPPRNPPPPPHPAADCDSAGRPRADSPVQPTADSAGQPWAGRNFDHHPTSFAGDDGAAPEALLAALDRFRSATAAETAASLPELAAAEVAVIDAVRDARLLVPLLAHAGETGVDERGRTIDKTQELSIVTVQAPDGRTALPAFTSTEAMARWNPKARPIPTPARRVALAAAGEGTDLLILDPTSPTEFAIRRPALWAIAEGGPWLPPLIDPGVQAAFEASIAGEPTVDGLRTGPGDAANRLRATEVVVELTLVAGLDRAHLDALLGRLQQRWAESEAIARGVDSLSVTLRQAPPR